MTIRWPCWKHVYYVPSCWRCRAHNDGDVSGNADVPKPHGYDGSPQ